MLYRRQGASLVEIGGADRERFLHGQCTADVLALAPGAASAAAFLTPKGKVLFLARIARETDRVRILLEEPRAALLASHLRKYAVFSDVAVAAPESHSRIDLYPRSSATPGAPSGATVWPPYAEFAASWTMPDSAADAAEKLLSESGFATASSAEQERSRIRAGRPAHGIDWDDAALFDELSMPEAVSYTKGCYVGQEIVARVKAYGRVTRRLVRLERLSGEPPPAGTALSAEPAPGTEVGRLTSAASDETGKWIGLGFVRHEIADGETVAANGNPPARLHVLPRVPR